MKLTYKPELSFVTGAMITKNMPTTGSLSDSTISVVTDLTTEVLSKTNTIDVIVGLSVV